MNTLSRKEWIAVTIALIVVLVAFGSRFLGFNGPERVVEEENISETNNSNMENASSTAGLIINDVAVGTGATAKNGDTVSVQYTGKFANGEVFDSSIPRGEPIEFQLGTGRVIKGWDQGILGMKVGGKRTLAIPPELGYGAAGYPPVIPPNSTLYFDVELVGVK